MLPPANENITEGTTDPFFFNRTTDKVLFITKTMKASNKMTSRMASKCRHNNLDAFLSVSQTREYYIIHRGSGFLASHDL